MPDDFKKIFIVSSYAPPSIGGPQTFYNLLCQLPPEHYCILTSFYAIDNLSAQKGTWLKGEYFFYDNPKGQPSDLISKKESSNKSNRLREYVQKIKFVMKRIPFVKGILGIPVILLQVIAIVRNGEKRIKESDSKIILGVSDYGPALIGSFFLHRKTKLPLTLFLFDIYKGNSFPFPGGLLASLFEKKILKSASTIIVNNEGTKDFYHNRYGDEISNKIKLVYNSVFPKDYEMFEYKESKKDGSPYTIIFTGRVNWPQLRSIKNLIQAVESMHDVNIQFKLYTPSPKDYLSKIGIVESDKVKLSFAPPQDMPKIQNDADILFLPLSWKTKSPGIINTATPAKLTDYLIAKAPILVHAPGESFLVKYAREYDFAEIVDEENIYTMEDKIKVLINNDTRRRELVQNAEKLFYKNHDAEKNIVIFKSIFQ